MSKRDLKRGMARWAKAGRVPKWQTAAAWVILLALALLIAAALVQYSS